MRKLAFSLVELLSTIAIVAILATVALVYVANYTSVASKVADHQTLDSLNSAIEKYQLLSGSTTALTDGKPFDHLISLLKTPVTSNGLTTQFLNSSFNPTNIRTVSARGNGKRYSLTRINAYEALTGGVSVALSAGSGPTFVASIANDITSAPASNGWELGCFESLTPANYTTTSINYAANTGWTGPFGFDTPLLSDGFMHPPIDAANYVSAGLKLSLPYTGTYTVSLSDMVVPNISSNGVSVILWLNGVQQGGTTVLSATPQNISQSVSATANDTLIIEFNSMGSFMYDGTEFSSITVSLN